ncbi:HEAT repeat domain-containing protein [Streptomyces sp. NPDC048420]|uniref:HEAT repeat domain-containing protein n=1 Tax=Streptomyces sp. NPDC048420 TaxID=3155755 RepID=UPI003416E231
MAGQGQGQGPDAMRMLRELEDGRASVRLRAALMVGTAPEARFVGPLVERCAVEPEFFVRDMLTWALTRHPSSVTFPALLREVRSERAQARSQALHTLSKIGDRRAWPAITRALLTDADDEVARTAWRAAVLLVPDGEEPGLAAVLATQFGRGERETQLSLSRALVALASPADLDLLDSPNALVSPMSSASSAPLTSLASLASPASPGENAQEAVVLPVLLAAASAPDPRVRAHALATERMLRDPDEGFGFAIEEAKRVVALGEAGRAGR